MTSDEKINKLRAEAEARLKSFSELSGDPSELEVKSLIHELGVYQIELEMQNQELREAQHRLEESRDQYSDLFEFAPLGYFILDRNGVILNCNLTGCRLLGIERMHLTGKPLALFIGQQPNVAAFRKYLQIVFKSEIVESCEIQMKRKSHPGFTARLDSIIMTDEKGQLTQCRMALNDISHEKKVESMQSLVEAVLYGQESERERIAAELHDSINPLLSIASLNADSLLPFLEKNEERSKDQLATIISLLESAMRGIKEISSNLSSSVLKNFGLSNALNQLCKKVRQADQLKIEYLTHGLENRLDPKTELALYRIAQELLNNILKHAHATQVEFQLIRHRESVVLMVSDNGVGFDAPEDEIKTNGFGFKNITSRVRSLYGNLSIDSVKEKGTTVTIELPI